MKIALVLHSQSGHTMHFARAIAAKFNNNGHDAEIMMLRTTGPVTPGARKFQIKNPPSVEGFDAALFGGPVMAFNASPVIMTYLGQLKNLKSMKVMSFGTKALPFLWTGGLQAAKNMDLELESSAGEIASPGEIVHFFLRPNNNELNAAVERIFNAFTA